MYSRWTLLTLDTTVRALRTCAGTTVRALFENVVVKCGDRSFVGLETFRIKADCVLHISKPAPLVEDTVPSQVAEDDAPSPVAATEVCEVARGPDGLHV